MYEAGIHERKCNMNKRILFSLILCLPVVLWIASCQTTEDGDRAIIPVTGKNAVPATVELARENVLEYVISSSRVANIPPSSEWISSGESTAGEFHFVSGDWLMIVLFEEGQEANQRVFLRNQAKHAFWCGYVDSDGHVVDTTYTR